MICEIMIRKVWNCQGEVNDMNNEINMKETLIGMFLKLNDSHCDELVVVSSTCKEGIIGVK